jgi:hypothetical protein
MVSFQDIQTAYYMVAATGVLIAAIYYILNLRYNKKAREMEVCYMFMHDQTSEQGVAKFATLMTMDWKDPEDFMKKYGYSNPEGIGKWVSYLFAVEGMGVLVKSGIADVEKLYDLGMFSSISVWDKYKDVIMNRRESWGQDYLTNAEYIVGELLKVRAKHNKSIKNTP